MIVQKPIKKKLSLLSKIAMTSVAGLSFCVSTFPAHGDTSSVTTIQHDLDIDPSAAEWLAGDHHVHSHYSVEWDDESSPPKPIMAGDAIYSYATNAQSAISYGLDWIALTDHGGPNHSRLMLESAYPELLRSRAKHPQLIQFYALELNTPGGHHSSVIVPPGQHESDMLYEIESQLDTRDQWPLNPERDTEAKMLEALATWDRLDEKPIVIANHPSKRARGIGRFKEYDPQEFYRWSVTAPAIAIGMAGAPGHQAKTLNQDGWLDISRHRGDYDKYPTLGGFDQMTAVVGGVWDGLLGAGRRWWITANSDSHIHHSEGGMDFWPGEYSKTYVFGQRTPEGILDGLRAGRIFVVTGDLVTSLELEAHSGKNVAAIGETLHTRGDSVLIKIRFTDPDTRNHGGDNPRVRRVDLIAGSIDPSKPISELGNNPTTRVIQRFSRGDWEQDGTETFIESEIPDVIRPAYIRIRGTSTRELEPEADSPGEDPWRDLWFYSNPIFIE